MVEHHRSAADRAQDEVDNGRNSDAVGLAETIVADHTAEIITMQELLASLSVTPAPGQRRAPSA